MDDLLPLRLRFQIGAEGVKGGRGVIPGKIDVPHGLHSALRIALRQILGGEHRAAAVYLLIQIRLEKFSGVGIKVLRADMDKIPCFVLRLHFGALIYKTVNVLPQTLPLGVGLGLRQMPDGSGNPPD